MPNTATHQAVSGADHRIGVPIKLGASAETIDALRNGTPIADTRLEAVRRFAAAVAGNRAQVSDAGVVALKAAGHDQRAVVAIALAVAAKTLVNAVAHLARPEIDDAFLPQAANA